MMCRLKKLWRLGGPSFLTQIKVKFTLEQAMKAQGGGEQRYGSTLSLDSPLDGVSG